MFRNYVFETVFISRDGSYFYALFFKGEADFVSHMCDRSGKVLEVHKMRREEHSFTNSNVNTGFACSGVNSL